MTGGFVGGAKFTFFGAIVLTGECLSLAKMGWFAGGSYTVYSPPDATVNQAEWTKKYITRLPTSSLACQSLSPNVELGIAVRVGGKQKAVLLFPTTERLRIMFRKAHLFRIPPAGTGEISVVHPIVDYLRTNDKQVQALINALPNAG